MSLVRPRRKKPLVLVVDDAEVARQMARDCLEEAGLDVVEAHDGREALRAFESERPDLVLLDVKMPELDGFEVCREIRRSPFGGDTPVLVMTALDDVDAIQRASQAGASDFGTRPLSWTLLAHRVRYMLRMGQVLEDLRHSEHRLARAQRLAQLGGWELDLGSAELRCDAEVARIYGLEAAATLSSWEDLVERACPEDREAVRADVEQAIREGAPLRVDHRITLPSGARRHVHVCADPVLDESAAPVLLEGFVQDITERKRAEAEIRFLAFHDGLTRLGNRYQFSERMSLCLAQARREGRQLAVLFLDLDHFHRINDMLGHEVGDLVLVQIAGRLRNCVRESDCVSRPSHADSSVSRFGGDEFLVGLAGIEAGLEAGQVAQRILEALQHPFAIGGQELVVTASIGIAVFPDDGDDIATLTRNADAARSRAKERGRNTFQFFEASTDETARRNLMLEADLRSALEGDELLLHFQPKLAIASGRITGFEALVRWQHPERGMIPPLRFIPLAERAGLIQRVSERVLELACRQLASWRDAGLPLVRVGVNLSAHDLRSGAVVDTLCRIARDAGVTPNLLDVEITETAMMQNETRTAQVLYSLRQLGTTVSLDDFGTGYSSLSYLRRFPVDTLKIDRSFVSEIESSPDDAAITAAILSMAGTLHLNVVAEGVETEEQLAYLRDHGGNEVQGFLFSPPVPGADATEMLRASAAGAALRRST